MRWLLLAFYPYPTLTGIFRSAIHHFCQKFHLRPSCVGLDVGVGVYRLLNVGVSKETLHDPDIHLCVNPSGGKGMP